MPANKKLEFLFKILDRVSAPSNKMAQSIRKLELAMGDARKEAIRLGSGLARINLVGRGADRAGRALRGARKEASGWSSTLQGIDSGISIFGRVTSAAWGAASAIAGVGASTIGTIAKIQQFGLEAADFKERTLIGFKTSMGGDQEGAEKLFKKAMKFARKTPFETQDTVNMFRQLKTAGFSSEENFLGVSDLDVAAKAIGDLTSVSGGGAEQINRITKAFQQIKSKDRLRAEELSGQLGDAGLDVGAVYETLQKNLGKTRVQLDKMMQAGKIDSDTGIFAIIQTMKETSSGGRLGAPMEELSGTLTGLWSTIKSAPFDMLVDLDKTMGFKQARGFFGNMAKALDPDSGPGGRVKARMERMFDDMFSFTFGGLSGSDGANKIADFMERAADIFEAGWKGIKTITTKIIDETTSYLKELGGGDVGKGLQEFTDKIVQGVGNAATGLAKLVPAMTTVLELIISAAEKVGLLKKLTPEDQKRVDSGKKLGVNVDRLENEKWLSGKDLYKERIIVDESIKAKQYENGVKLGEFLGMGFQDGINQNMGYWDAAKYAMEYATKGAADEAQIKSPSKVFEYFGLMTARGFSEGVESGQGTAEDRIRDLMSSRGSPFDTSSAGASPSISSAAPSGRGLSIGSLSVVVQAGAQSDPQATAAAVAEILPEALLEALERINMETGNQ